MTNSSFPYCPNSKPTNAQQTMLRKTAPYQKAQANQIHTTTPLNQMWIIPTFPLPAKFDALRERERDETGEIRTARTRTHAKQHGHKCGFGALRGVRELSSHKAKREGGKKKREEKRCVVWCGGGGEKRTKQPLPAAPLLPPAAASAFLTASAVSLLTRHPARVSPPPYYSDPPGSTRRATTAAVLLCHHFSTPLHSPLLPPPLSSRLVSTRLALRLCCAVVVAARGARWPEEVGEGEGRRRRRSTTSWRRTPSRTSSPASPTASPALLRGVRTKPPPYPIFSPHASPPRSCRGLSFALCFRLVDRDSDGSPLPRVVFARLLLPRVGGGGLRACVYYYAGVLRCCAWVVAVVVFAREWIDLLELSSLGTWYAFLKAICLFVLFSRLFNNTSH